MTTMMEVAAGSGARQQVGPAMVVAAVEKIGRRLGFDDKDK